MAKVLASPKIAFFIRRQAARLQKRFVPLVMFLVFFLGMALIQFATPDMPDNDGFYHIKLARSRYSSGSAN